MDARALVAEPVEGDGPGVPRAAHAAPGHAHVWNLLRDLGLPLDRLASDFGLPEQAARVELVHGLDALHEAREFLELRPLVVGGRERDLDLDALPDLGPGHGVLL